MSFKKFLYKTGDTLKEKSPEILMVLGVASFVVTVVNAYKASPKVDRVLDKHNEQMNAVNALKGDLERGEEIEIEDGELYTFNDVKRDKLVIMMHTCINMGKVLAPTIISGVVTLTCFLSSYAIIHKRYVAASVLAAGLSDTLTKYRERVIGELGREMDDHFLNGTEISKVKVTEMGEDGTNKTKTEKIANVSDPNGIPIYAKFFDESNVNWSKSPNTNLLFLRGQQAHANDIFKIRGRLLLNDVYTMLGLEQTEIGTMVGWFEGHGDQFVDFGIYDGNERTRAFVNGYERNILLNFNCVPRMKGDLSYA